MERLLISDILTFFRNVTLNAIGAKRDIYQLLDDNDVSTAIMRMDGHDMEVDNAIKEYNPQTHDVMYREDKWVKGERPYMTEKLPRSRQRYINEVELFFLLGNPIEWKKEDGDDDAFTIFRDYLDEIHFDSKIRQVKRYAGAETESAFCFHFYRTDGGAVGVVPFVAARTKGYRLRTLFDQYGNMQCGAIGYSVRQDARTIQCWDIFTDEVNYHCERRQLGWAVERYPNPTGKINMIYFRQPKSWDGAEFRIRREEELDSRAGDTNNYFADPIAAATADVINSMPKRDKPGKLIQLTGANSKFEYITPPQNSEARDAEKRDLRESILFDTLTPDLSPDVMRNISTLTSVGIKRALVLGYIKRANRQEIYGELIERFKNLTISVLSVLHPDMKSKLEGLKISFEFSEPFNDDKTDLWGKIGTAYQQGVMSLDEAVALMALTNAPKSEVERIRQAEQERAAAGKGGQEP